MIFLKCNLPRGISWTLAYDPILDGPIRYYLNDKNCEVIVRPGNKNGKKHRDKKAN